MNNNKADISTESLTDWMVTYLEDLFDITIDSSDYTTDFVDLGIDSTGLIGLSVDMSDWLNQDIDLEIFIEHRSIASASRHIANTLS